MSQPTDTPRKRLSRARVIEAAVALADEIGLEAFSMRGLAQELGVVDMVDTVFSEMEPPSGDEDWRSALRCRALSAREALKRHSWAIGLMESRHPGPANLRHHNATMGCLREAGFSFELAVHAYSVQDAYIYGFALQEKDLGFKTPESAGKAARRRAERIGPLDDYPYLAEIVTSLPESGYNNADEFAWGLDLILDGLDRLRRGA
jgi:Tetracyclin repressor-like, C-terminal domain